MSVFLFKFFKSLILFFFSSPLDGGNYRIEEYIQSDWEMSGIGVQGVKFPKNQNKNKQKTKN